MIHRHLIPRVLAIAGAAAAITLAAANAVPASADTPVEHIEVTANASVQAVRLHPPTPSTPATTVRPGATTVPAKVTPIQCGTPLDNYGDGRSGGRAHEGDDIVAPQNTPVLAVVDGTLTDQVRVGDSNASLSGNAWYLRDDATGASYFYAHLDHFAELAVGAKVKAGDVIAYVGDTGNPAPGSYHLHFEIHPAGRSGAAVNPQPYLAVTPCPKA
jgi:murein DD-endopeptidase MepM/ murein hydrolase activator NlpD